MRVTAKDALSDPWIIQKSFNGTMTAAVKSALDNIKKYHVIP